MSGSRVLYESAKYLVVNKPAQVAMQGKPITPAGAAWKALLTDYTRSTKSTAPLRVVHRLDAGTSGVLVLAKTESAARVIGRQFEQGDVRKTYHAIVDTGNGGWRRELGRTGSMRNFLKTTPTGVIICDNLQMPACKEAIAEWELLQSSGRFSYVRLHPSTGRKHQLRIQCAEVLRAPVVGDFKYGYSGRPVRGHLLHCQQMQFYAWEKDGKRETVSVEAPLPESFSDFASTSGLDLSTLRPPAAVG